MDLSPYLPNILCRLIVLLQKCCEHPDKLLLTCDVLGHHACSDVVVVVSSKGSNLSFETDEDCDGLKEILGDFA